CRTPVHPLSSSRPCRPPAATPFPYTALFRSRCPFSRRSRTTCDPMYPAPPITRVVMGASLPRQSPAPDIGAPRDPGRPAQLQELDRKSTRLNSSHVSISYAVFWLKQKHYTST